MLVAEIVVALVSSWRKRSSVWKETWRRLGCDSETREVDFGYHGLKKESAVVVAVVVAAAAGGSPKEVPYPHWYRVRYLPLYQRLHHHYSQLLPPRQDPLKLAAAVALVVLLLLLVARFPTIDDRFPF